MKNTEILQKDIWLVEFNPQIGSEIAKTRPAVVINDDLGENFSIKIVVPITSWQDKFKQSMFYLRLKDYAKFGLDNPSAVNCFQIKSFSTERFKRKIGQIDDKTLFEIHQIVANILDPSYELVR